MALGVSFPQFLSTEDIKFLQYYHSHDQGCRYCIIKCSDRTEMIVSWHLTGAWMVSSVISYLYDTPSVPKHYSFWLLDA
jgi:hypothetical protein